MITIQTADDVEKLRKDLGARLDWHEPDEQNITARIVGTHLDNAIIGHSETLPPEAAEFAIQIFKDGEPVAHANLAYLLYLVSDAARRLAARPVDEIPNVELTTEVVRLRQQVAAVGKLAEKFASDASGVSGQPSTVGRAIALTIVNALTV